MTIRASICLLRVAAVVASVMGTSGAPPAAFAADFRVENKVFVNNEKEPRTQSTTIFFGGSVYDYLEKPKEITVFDVAHHRFVLLDPARHVKTELTTDEVVALVDNLKRWATTQTDQLLRFLGDPKFEETFDEATGDVWFKSPWVTYRVAGVPAESTAMLQQYREFSDWYTRLNARLNPGSKLPFARLRVNEVLYQRQELPREVRLTMQSKRGISFQKHYARSEHQVIRRLVQEDRDRIAQTDQFLAIFRPIPFDEYQKKIGP